MYLEYYRLNKHPFKIVPDPSLFFTGGKEGRGMALEALAYAIISGEGILKVVGEVGSGKTMLCRMLQKRLPDSIEVVYIANPSLSKEQILFAIAFELKLAVTEQSSRLQMMQELQNYLLSKHANGESVVVIIEEAQSMPLETLEELRLFVNLETHEAKLMQLVLFGQPELDVNLQQKSIRQLRERITHSFYLRPLTLDETAEYIRFRLTSAGCPDANIFTDSALKKLASASKGLTRRINILADKALMAAFADSSKDFMPSLISGRSSPAVRTRHVKAAIRDAGYQVPVWKTTAAAIALVLLIITVSRIIYLLFPTITNSEFFLSIPHSTHDTRIYAESAEIFQSKFRNPQV
jgi:MSHA biogenesis protein MshM